MTVYLLYINGTFYCANTNHAWLRSLGERLESQCDWKAEVWECDPASSTLRLVEVEL